MDDDNTEEIDQAITLLQRVIRRMKDKGNAKRRKKADPNSLPPAGVKGSSVNTSNINWQKNLRPHLY